MYESAEDYMESIRALKSSIENKLTQLSVLQETISLTSANYDIERIRSSQKHDKLEQKVLENIEKRESLQRKIEDELTEMVERQDTAVDIINMLESEEQKKVLMLRYIKGKDWWEIMLERGRDDLSGQYKLHKRALDSLQKLLDVHFMSI